MNDMVRAVPVGGSDLYGLFGMLLGVIALIVPLAGMAAKRENQGWFTWLSMGACAIAVSLQSLDIRARILYVDSQWGTAQARQQAYSYVKDVLPSLAMVSMILIAAVVFVNIATLYYTRGKR